MCEIGKLNILYETALLSQYMAAPRLGHLHQALNIFKYLKKKDNHSWQAFDPMSYDVEWVLFGDESHPMKQAKVLQEMYDVGKP